VHYLFWIRATDDRLDRASALFEIIRSGEARLAVALAVIEGDDPDPDGGDEADNGGGETVAA
jgi:hypothetical protein